MFKNLLEILGLLPIGFNQLTSTLSDYPQARHARREAGIQCHGWQT